MSDHEGDLLIEFRAQVRAWGEDRFWASMDDLAAQIAARSFRGVQKSGVIVYLCPGGGGPYGVVVQEPWLMRTDGVNAPGYPGKLPPYNGGDDND